MENSLPIQRYGAVSLVQIAPLNIMKINQGRRNARKEASAVTTQMAGNVPFLGSLPYLHNLK
jgi:hypothetical protein